MSVQSAKFFATPSAAQPRSAVRSPVVLVWLTRAGRWVWRELEAMGQARANGELRRMAQQYAHDPQVAQALLDAIRPPGQSNQRG